MTETTIINAAISGGIGVAFAMLGVCFLRFWRSSGVRLFFLFAVSFYLLTIERVVLLLADPDNEFAPYIYTIRLAAFLVIIGGIIDQNRRGGGRST